MVVYIDVGVRLTWRQLLGIGDKFFVINIKSRSPSDFENLSYKIMVLREIKVNKIQWFYLCELQVSLWYSLLDFGVSYGIFTPNKSDRSTLILSCLVSNRVAPRHLRMISNTR